MAYARCLNVIMRHSDVIDIATMADFFGTVWQVNAVMLPAPIFGDKKPYLQPVGAVMRLFGKYQGEMALDCSCNDGVDAVASRTGNKVYLHLANTDMKKAQKIELDIGQTAVMHRIAADPTAEITPDHDDIFRVKDIPINPRDFTLPAAAVAAVEIDL